jgi:hypothetical protein
MSGGRVFGGFLRSCPETHQGRHTKKRHVSCHLFGNLNGAGYPYPRLRPRCHTLGKHNALGKLDAAYSHRWRRLFPYIQYALFDRHHTTPRGCIVAIVDAVKTLC